MGRRRDPRLPGFDTARGDAKRFGGNRRGGLKWRCHQCGELPKSWAAAERHADEMGHHRIEVVL